MGRRRRRRQLANLGPDGMPQPLKWRPRVRIFGIISGALGGLGTAVLVQQYGIAPLTRALTLRGLIGGALSGVILPSLIFAFVVRRYNRKLAEARGRSGRGPAAAGGLGAVLLFMILLATFAVSGTGPASAEVDGTCDLVVNGQDVRGLRMSASDAIDVASEESLTGFLRSSSDFASFELRFFYAGFSYGFGDGEVEDDPDGGGGTYTFELPVNELFQYSGGLYEVRGGGVLANGQNCTFGLLFNVDQNPMDTVVGQVAAGAAAIGVVGLLGVSVSTLVEGGRMLTDLSSMLVDLDHDGIADAVALDVNADGVVDAVGVDTTGDGLADEFAVDSDADGTFDRVVEKQDLGTASETGTAAAEVPPGEVPTEPPSVEVPPTEAPPTAEAPPTDTPPVEPPTAETPPTDTPPTAEAPPTDTPPADTPTDTPTETPPDQPATSEPPVAEPPVVEPPPGPGAPPPAPPEMPGSPPPAPPTGPDSVPPDVGTPPPSPPIEAGGGGVDAEIAGGVILGPAAVGALAKAVQKRSSGSPSDDEPFWFSVDQPTPMFGLDEYKEVGEVVPGSWYLAVGTYGDWIHAADQDMSVEGWIAARAAKPESSP